MLLTSLQVHREVKDEYFRQTGLHIFVETSGTYGDEGDEDIWYKYVNSVRDTLYKDLILWPKNYAINDEVYEILVSMMLRLLLTTEDSSWSEVKATVEKFIEDVWG